MAAGRGGARPHGDSHRGGRLRDEGNYFGPTLNRATRLRAVAHPGQVLVSGPTADLVADRLPAEASLVELGVHRLTDQGRPERVWPLRHPDLSTVLDAPEGLEVLPHNLPAQLSSFVGRRPSWTSCAPWWPPPGCSPSPAAQVYAGCSSKH